MAKSRETNMTEGSITKNVIWFSVPLVLSGILQLFYNAADIIVVGQFSGSNAMAAVGATSSLVNMIFTLFMSLSVGTSVLVATAFGAQDREKTHHALHSSIALSLVSGVIVLVLGLLFSRTALIWMGTPSEILDLSNLYMKIFFIGAPANLFYNFGAMALRAVGDTKRPLIFLALSGIVNVVLNLVLVIVFHMSVEGVAIATVVSQYVSAAFIYMALAKNNGFLHLEIKKIKFHKNTVIKILKIGIPAGIQGIIFSFSNIIIQSSLNSFGSDAIAGNTAMVSIEGFIYVVTNSLSQAAVTIVGQNFGAKKYNRIGKSVLSCSILAIVSGLAMGIIFTIFGEQLISIYSTKSSVIHYGMLRMQIVILPYFTLGLMEVLVGGTRGLGVSFTPTLISVFGVCVVRIAWVYTIFEMFKTLETLYISYPISWALTAAAQLVCFLVAKKLMVKRAIVSDDALLEK